MKIISISGAALATTLTLFVLAAAPHHSQDVERIALQRTGTADGQGFLYGRVATDDGEVYEGRLRWGGSEEASWGDYFNGAKSNNVWADHVPSDRLTERDPVNLFGFTIAHRERTIDLGRPFMTRFGDIARIEARGRKIWVTVKSGSTFELDRFAADDLADGVRVWDTQRGVVDLDEWGINSIEFLATAQLGDAPSRLHGTVRTSQGDFTGFIQWNREEGVVTDALNGFTAEGEHGLRYDTIRSIERKSSSGSTVRLLDGSEVALSGTPEAGDGNRGIYVDDRRYGRVLISWDAFERVEFSPGGSGPTYNEFPPGLPLTGSVTTRSGRRLEGRLVYDLDESESTETLDAPIQGIDYTIPFGLVAVIEPHDNDHQLIRVVLQSGEEVDLERAGDLGDKNAGMLIFVEGSERPEYVHWTELQRVDFNRPSSMYPGFRDSSK